MFIQRCSLDNGRVDGVMLLDLCKQTGLRTLMDDVIMIIIIILTWAVEVLVQ